MTSSKNCAARASISFLLRASFSFSLFASRSFLSYVPALMYLYPFATTILFDGLGVVVVHVVDGVGMFALSGVLVTGVCFSGAGTLTLDV